MAEVGLKYGKKDNLVLNCELQFCSLHCILWAATVHLSIRPMAFYVPCNLLGAATMVSTSG